jgi:outer membrane protein
MMRTTVGLWVLVIGAALVPAGAADAQTNLSLEDAVARALERAPRVAEARARGRAAEAAVSAREALKRPTVTALTGLLRTNHVEEFGIRQPDGSLRVIFPDIPTNYRTRAEVAVPLYTSGRVDAQVASARADMDAAVADVRTVRADIELETVAAYWTLVMARARVSVLERARDRADAVVGDVQARVDAGLLPPNDVLSARAQRARQRVLLIQAENDVALAEAQLARLVGGQAGERFVPVTPVARPTPGIEALLESTTDGLAKQAAEARSERLALALRQRALRSGADALLFATRPQLGLLGAVEPARPNPRFVPRADRWHTSWDLGVTLTWALWDGGRSRADRAAAAAQADAISARIEDFDALVAVDVRQRQLDLVSTRAAIAASTEAVEASTEARRVVGERFAAGVATSTEVLDSDVALLEAELERTRLEAALRLSEARLVRAVGGR